MNQSSMIHPSGVGTSSTGLSVWLGLRFTCVVGWQVSELIWQVMLHSYEMGLHEELYTPSKFYTGVWQRAEKMKMIASLRNMWPGKDFY